MNAVRVSQPEPRLSLQPKPCPAAQIPAPCVPGLTVPLDCRCSSVCLCQVGVCMCRKQLQLGGWVCGEQTGVCACVRVGLRTVCMFVDVCKLQVHAQKQSVLSMCVCVWLCMCVVVGHRKLQERYFCNTDVAALYTSSMYGGAVSTGTAFRAECWCAIMQTECDEPSAFLFCAFACTLTCLAGRYYLELLLCSVAVDVVIV